MQQEAGRWHGYADGEPQARICIRRRASSESVQQDCMRRASASASGYKFPSPLLPERPQLSSPPIRIGVHDQHRHPSLQKITGPSSFFVVWLKKHLFSCPSGGAVLNSSRELVGV
jgi:hypothetical protein